MTVALPLEVAPYIVIAALLTIQHGNAQLYDYTQAVSGWGPSSDYPSAQARSAWLASCRGPVMDLDIAYP